MRQRDLLLCAALGSPDPYGRQLDGMGGGLSSLSKAMIVGRSECPGVDLDYTFAQVAIDEFAVDYSGNCGNLSSAVVPFALAAGLVSRDDGVQRFTLYNTNTGQTVEVRLRVEGGLAAVDGELALPGVSGTGAAIDLVYPDPGGSHTAGLLPTGAAADVLRVGDREVRVSIVDATVPLVLVAASQFGLTGAEHPEAIDADSELMARLKEVRRAGAVLAGLCDDPAAAPLAVPKITLVAPAADSVLLDGTVLAADAVDLLVRPISVGQAHRAVPGTGAMCLAAAAQVPGTVVAEFAWGVGALRAGAGSTTSASTDTSAVGNASAKGDTSAKDDPSAAGSPSAKDGPSAADGQGASDTSGALVDAPDDSTVPVYSAVPADSGAPTVCTAQGNTQDTAASRSVRLGTASGVVTAAAVPTPDGGIAETSLARTARILMRGQVAV
ncbi:MAG: PrpF domain-containing protein [Leucobacter sp.]